MFCFVLLCNRRRPFWGQNVLPFGKKCTTCLTLNKSPFIKPGDSKSLEAREELRVVALDIRGTFDRVWWRGLLAHLQSIGIRGRALALLKSYLSDRSFVVATNGEESEVCQIRSGIPQGGIWSPLFFDLFIRRLPEEAQHAAMLCYADDVTLVMQIPTGGRETSAALLNSDIERILKFGKKWLLEFEAKKTKQSPSAKRGM